MIVRPRPGWGLLFVLHGSILPRIVPHLIGFALYAAAVVAMVRAIDLQLLEFGAAPFALLGVALSLYLGFRNNAAYERWWEARKLWGQLIFDMRNLARAVNAIVHEADERRALMMEALAFCHLLRGQLRKIDTVEDARNFADATVDVIRSSLNQANALLNFMGQRIAVMKRAGVISDIDFRILDERLAGFTAMQAGCERISNTPVPFAYTLLLQRSAYAFCLLIPFAMATTAGWATVLFTVLIAYCFFGLDALSQELEDPFGSEANDLALDTLCRVCEISVFEALGETPPDLPKPVNGYYFS
ncbi:MAG: bestrophin family ion channel [Pseudomonadota bacterium]